MSRAISETGTPRALAGGLRSFKLARAKQADTVVGAWRRTDSVESPKRTASSDRGLRSSSGTPRRKNTWCSVDFNNSLDIDHFGSENRPSLSSKPKKLKSSSASFKRISSLDLVLKSMKSSTYSPKLGSKVARDIAPLSQNFFQGNRSKLQKGLRSGSRDSDDLKIENFS